MNMIRNKASERQEIEALLPWHAAGTLSRRDAHKVEQALQSDADLAIQYATVRQDLVETIGLNESLVYVRPVPVAAAARAGRAAPVGTERTARVTPIRPRPVRH